MISKWLKQRKINKECRELEDAIHWLNMMIGKKATHIYLTKKHHWLIMNRWPMWGTVLKDGELYEWMGMSVLSTDFSTMD